MPCKLCGSPGTNASSCPLNEYALSPSYSKHRVAPASPLPPVPVAAPKPPPSSFATIVLEPTDGGSDPLLKQLVTHFQSVCHYDQKVMAKAKPDPFSSKWQDVEHSVKGPGYVALTRLFNDTTYTDNTHRVFIIQHSEGQIQGFIAGVIDVLPLVDHRLLKSYDNMKYKLVYDQMDTTDISVSWIEILCVHPDIRGKELGKKLITAFEEVCKSRFQGRDGFVGIDLSGTEEQGINVPLKKHYEKLGYDFDMPTARYLNMNPSTFGGAQFGVKVF